MSILVSYKESLETILPRESAPSRFPAATPAQLAAWFRSMEPVSLHPLCEPVRAGRVTASPTGRGPICVLLAHDLAEYEGFEAALTGEEVALPYAENDILRGAWLVGYSRGSEVRFARAADHLNEVIEKANDLADLNAMARGWDFGG